MMEFDRLASSEKSFVKHLTRFLSGFRARSGSRVPLPPEGTKKTMLQREHDYDPFVRSPLRSRSACAGATGCSKREARDRSSHCVAHRARCAQAVSRKRKSDVEHLVATLRPQPDVAATVRKLPQRKLVVADESVTIDPPREPLPAVAAIATSPAPVPTVRSHRLAEVKPLAPARYKIQFTASRECYERLRRAQDLLRHSVPNGDPAVIFERALALLVAELERTKLAATQRPRCGRATMASSRHIPAVVRRAVWKRDGGRCAFRGTHGRCGETGLVEFHHVRPFAAGGKATCENIELRCRTHNLYEADQYFGPRESLFSSNISAPGA